MNKIMKYIPLLCLLFAFPAFADEPTCDQQLADQGVMPAMMDCIQIDINTKDAELNAIYREFRQYASTEEKSFIQQAQRSWLAMVEADEKFIFSTHGGGQNSQLLSLEYRLQALTERVERLGSHLYIAKLHYEQSH